MDRDADAVAGAPDAPVENVVNIQRARGRDQIMVALRVPEHGAGGPHDHAPDIAQPGDQRIRHTDAQILVALVGGAKRLKRQHRNTLRSGGSVSLLTGRHSLG